MHIFNQCYTINGYQKLITETLRSCTGSCKLTKWLNTSASPPPQPVRTKYVMERIQIDLLQMYGPKSPLCIKSSHTYHLVMSVMDFFSKYCWLIPLCTKTAIEVARACTIWLSENYSIRQWKRVYSKCCYHCLFKPRYYNNSWTTVPSTESRASGKVKSKGEKVYRLYTC